MTVTCFLSMWLSNTACAAMMIPIACAVLKELDDHRRSIRQKHAGAGVTNTFIPVRRVAASLVLTSCVLVAA